MFQVIEVENFFENPDLIRDFALSQEFNPYIYTPNSIWSGFRAPINNQAIETELFEKIEKESGKKIRSFVSRFHLNPGVSMHGYPHVDAPEIDSFAGVVYLNRTYPENCGTTIYEDLPIHKSFVEKYIPNYVDKMEIVYNVNLNINNRFKQQYSQECLNFKTYVLKKFKSVDFEFNKMVLYPGNVLHSPDFYFGDNKNNSRLTIAFHGNFHAI